MVGDALASVVPSGPLPRVAKGAATTVAVRPVAGEKLLVREFRGRDDFAGGATSRSTPRPAGRAVAFRDTDERLLFDPGSTRERRVGRAWHGCCRSPPRTALMPRSASSASPP